jgi:hypothetical protein
MQKTVHEREGERQLSRHCDIGPMKCFLNWNGRQVLVEPVVWHLGNVVFEMRAKYVMVKSTHLIISIVK